MPNTPMDIENLIVMLYCIHLFNCFSLNSFKHLIWDFSNSTEIYRSFFFLFFICKSLKISVYSSFSKCYVSKIVSIFIIAITCIYCQLQFVWNFQVGFVRTIYPTLQKLYVAHRYNISFFHLPRFKTWTLQTLEFHIK